jgi:RNA polymerase sigma-70 factor (ECF subfamily)
LLLRDGFWTSPALLARHQQRLRQAVAYRLDRRLAARVDASGVVQEALAEASRRLPEFARARILLYRGGS